MSQNFINEKAFCDHLRAVMESQLKEVSEKFIAEAMKKHEEELRRQIGIIVLSLISEYSVDRMGNILQITVKTAK